MEHIKTLQNKFNMSSRSKDGEIYSIKDNKGYWVSQNGERRYPNEFDYEHLINTLKKIERICYSHYICPEDFKIYRLLKEEYTLRIINNQHLE